MKSKECSELKQFFRELLGIEHDGEIQHASHCSGTWRALAMPGLCKAIAAE
jgi:hypothetical protein